MFKKITLIILFILSFFLFLDFSYWTCKLWEGKIGDSLEACLDGSDVLQADDLTVTSWFKKMIVWFIQKISTILAILAVWSIAYWSMVIVTSVWSDDKIKKWRNIIKWSLLWFLILVSASWIIKIIIYFVYWL